MQVSGDPVHGYPADVFMMGITIWEALAVEFSRFEDFFSEGKGLPDSEIQQITKPVSRRVTGERVALEKQGLGVLFERLVACVDLQTAAALCDLCGQTLLQSPEHRPTMPQLMNSLKTFCLSPREITASYDKDGLSEDLETYRLLSD